MGQIIRKCELLGFIFYNGAWSSLGTNWIDLNAQGAYQGPKQAFCLKFKTPDYNTNDESTLTITIPFMFQQNTGRSPEVLDCHYQILSQHPAISHNIHTAEKSTAFITEGRFYYSQPYYDQYVHKITSKITARLQPNQFYYLFFYAGGTSETGVGPLRTIGGINQKVNYNMDLTYNPAATKLPSPQNLSVASVSTGGKISINWSMVQSSDVKGYQLSINGAAQTFSIGNNRNSFTISNQPQGKRYTIRIQTLSKSNSSNDSDWSSEVSTYLNAPPNDKPVINTRIISKYQSYGTIDPPVIPQNCKLMYSCSSKEWLVYNNSLTFKANEECSFKFRDQYGEDGPEVSLIPINKNVFIEPTSIAITPDWKNPAYNGTFKLDFVFPEVQNNEMTAYIYIIKDSKTILLTKKAVSGSKTITISIGVNSIVYPGEKYSFYIDLTDGIDNQSYNFKEEYASPSLPDILSIFNQKSNQNRAGTKNHFYKEARIQLTKSVANSVSQVKVYNEQGSYMFNANITRAQDNFVDVDLLYNTSQGIFPNSKYYFGLEYSREDGKREKRYPNKLITAKRNESFFKNFSLGDSTFYPLGYDRTGAKRTIITLNFLDNCSQAYVDLKNIKFRIAHSLYEIHTSISTTMDTINVSMELDLGLLNSLLKATFENGTHVYEEGKSRSSKLVCQAEDNFGAIKKAEIPINVDLYSPPMDIKVSVKDDYIYEGLVPSFVLTFSSYQRTGTFNYTIQGKVKEKYDTIVSGSNIFTTSSPRDVFLKKFTYTYQPKIENYQIPQLISTNSEYTFKAALNGRYSQELILTTKTIPKVIYQNNPTISIKEVLITANKAVSIKYECNISTEKASEIGITFYCDTGTIKIASNKIVILGDGTHTYNWIINTDNTILISASEATDTNLTPNDIIKSIDLLSSNTIQVWAEISVKNSISNVIKKGNSSKVIYYNDVATFGFRRNKFGINTNQLDNKEKAALIVGSTENNTIIFIGDHATIDIPKSTLNGFVIDCGGW